MTRVNKLASASTSSLDILPSALQRPYAVVTEFLALPDAGSSSPLVSAICTPQILSPVVEDSDAHEEVPKSGTNGTSLHVSPSSPSSTRGAN